VLRRKAAASAGGGWAAIAEDAVGSGAIGGMRSSGRVGRMPLPSRGVVLVQKQEPGEGVVAGGGEGVVAEAEELPLLVPWPGGWR
jgi:hypothetical protein